MIKSKVSGESISIYIFIDVYKIQSFNCTT